VGGTQYTGTITTAANDAAGNALSSSYIWTFTTAVAQDTTPPTVSSTSPENGATDIALNSSISATFSEAMTNSTLNNVTFNLKRTAGATPVIGTVNVNGNTARFIPSADLAAGNQYTATITTGAKDAAGNALRSNFIWNFTAASSPDITPPTVSATSPTNTATGVPLNSSISATFSEAMTDSTVNNASFTLKSSSGNVPGTVNLSGDAATFTPSAFLVANTLYTATITTAAKDAAGNAFVADYNWSFMTVVPASNGSANLSWDAVTTPNLGGYRVYYGTSPGTYLQSFGSGLNVGSVQSYTVSALNSGTRYYFAVTAFDALGQESGYSNEVFKDIP
jgi:hypothetical protein